MKNWFKLSEASEQIGLDISAIIEYAADELIQVYMYTKAYYVNPTGTKLEVNPVRESIDWDLIKTKAVDQKHYKVSTSFLRWISLKGINDYLTDPILIMQVGYMGHILVNNVDSHSFQPHTDILQQDKKNAILVPLSSEYLKNFFITREALEKLNLLKKEKLSLRYTTKQDDNYHETIEALAHHLLRQLIIAHKHGHLNKNASSDLVDMIKNDSSGIKPSTLAKQLDYYGSKYFNEDPYVKDSPRKNGFKERSLRDNINKLLTKYPI